MIRRDMNRVLDIETESFDFPWSKEDFLACLRQRNCVGMVAELPDKQIAGFMVYELARHHIELLSLAVGAEFRRDGIGTQLVERLVAKLKTQKRTAISTVVRETNLAAQLFFRDRGFLAIEIERNFYENNSEDAYRLVYDLGDA